MRTSGRMHIISVLLLPIVLVSCGSSGSGAVDPGTTFSDNVNAFTAMSTTVAGNTTTGDPGLGLATNIPNSGSATYNGYTAILISNAADPTNGAVLVSPSSLTANFANGTIGGSATAFTGRNADLTDPNNATYTGPASDYAGQITLSNGCVGTTCTAGIATTVQATASGTLTGGGNTVTLTKPLNGSLYGSNAQAVDISSSSTSGSATLNGATAKSTMEIVGQK